MNIIVSYSEHHKKLQKYRAFDLHFDHTFFKKTYKVTAVFHPLTAHTFYKEKYNKQPNYLALIL